MALISFACELRFLEAAVVRGNSTASVQYVGTAIHSASLRTDYTFCIVSLAASGSQSTSIRVMREASLPLALATSITSGMHEKSVQPKG